MERVVRKFRRARRQRVRACAALTVLALVVSMGTGLALIRPAATMENTTYCDLETHAHDEACYEPALICTDENREGHTHEDACWAYPCGMDETEGHEHNEECYSLGCGMVEAHIHTDCVDCALAEAHTHTDGCYENAGTLICGKEELPEHVHSESCMTLTCGLEACEAHSHELCGEKVLICGKEEYAKMTDDQKSAVTNSLTTPASGEIVIKGVAAGDYTVKETNAPDGYNKLVDDITVPAQKLTETETSVTKYLDEDGNVVDEETSTVVTYENEDLAATVTFVVNKAGIELPSTGGVGTTVFYIIGAVLMLGAVVVLVSRKRMAA